MREFVYPARFTADKQEGGFVVAFRDIPEAITQGDSHVECLAEAASALQAALYLEMRRAGISRVELARRLRIDEKEARRMLDPYHATKADRLEKALVVLGRHAVLRVA